MSHSPPGSPPDGPTQEEVFYPPGSVWDRLAEEFFVDVMAEHATTNNQLIHERCPSIARAFTLLTKREPTRFTKRQVRQRFNMLKARHLEFARIRRLPGVVHNVELRTIKIKSKIMRRDIQQNFTFGSAYLKIPEMQWTDLVKIFGPGPGQDYHEPAHFITLSSSNAETPPRTRVRPNARRVLQGAIPAVPPVSQSTSSSRPPARRALLQNSYENEVESQPPHLGFNYYHSSASTESVSSTGEGPNWYGTGALNPSSFPPLPQYVGPAGGITFSDLRSSSDYLQTSSPNPPYPPFYPGHNADVDGGEGPSGNPYSFGPRY